uniref:Rho-GAP domain-containing protein n=1 Tax=Gadus morhua TaxID=8049 RepID=A0A8C5FJ25_GADMO
MVEFLDKTGILNSFELYFELLFVRSVYEHFIYLLPLGVRHKGIFRLSGSVVQTRQLRLQWDRGEAVDLQQDSDVPTVASLLKLFFRELPIPLVPEAHRSSFLIVEYKDEQELIGFLKDILGCLPVDYFSILSYLIHFLARVASHSQSNQMPMENLATIFGPCTQQNIPEGFLFGFCFPCLHILSILVNNYDPQRTVNPTPGQRTYLDPVNTLPFTQLPVPSSPPPPSPPFPFYLSAFNLPKNEY